MKSSCCLLPVMLMLLGFATGVPAAEGVSPRALREATHAAAQYLVRQVQEDGRFRYRWNTNPQIAVTPKYNMLRHCGTMFAMTDYHRTYPHPATREALTRALRFLNTQIGPLQDVPDVLAVWSDPRVNGGNDSRRVKLGGVGLGLVATTQLANLPGLALPQRRMQQLGEFLLFMQNEAGGFYSFYIPGFPGREDSWTSLYYPGEAALGLIMLWERDPDPAWRRGAYEALRYLAKEREGQRDVPADHWTLIATARLLDHKLPPEFDRALLLTHARQIVSFMLREQAGQAKVPELVGCFSYDGRTTPTATRLEGLLAARSFLSDAALTERIDRACHQGLAFLMKVQLKQDEARGGIPRARAPLARSHPGWSESFNARSTEIRIDYVQHALSAMLAYRARFHDGK